MQQQSAISGKDAKIRQIIERTIQSSRNGNYSSSYQSEVNRLINQGGSLARSSALHIACANQNTAMVEYILRKDPSTLESRDETTSTPLMIAAASAAAQGKMMGIIDSSNQPVIDLLLASGARKDAVNSKGMTAYGNLLHMHHQFNAMMMQSIMGGPGVRGEGAASITPGLSELLSKLMPPGGPTAADRSAVGQEGLIMERFVDYS
mmetsp:Transcript_28636/g.69377  ORF Transcript_28636/g.69377 Transcript_28636/m.69377 type:complete len:206 (-) Transcript_28636:1305-1922(-)